MATIEVSRLIGVRRPEVHALLADVEAHALLSVRGLQLVAAADAPSSPHGLIRVNPPGPLKRTVSTVMSHRDNPSTIAGTARIGRRRVADIVWSLDSRGSDTLVLLSARTRKLSRVEHVVLVLGGRWWIRRRFRKVLERLDNSLSRGERHGHSVGGR